MMLIFKNLLQATDIVLLLYSLLKNNEHIVTYSYNALYLSFKICYCISVDLI